MGVILSTSQAFVGVLLCVWVCFAPCVNVVARGGRARASPENVGQLSLYMLLLSCAATLNGGGANQMRHRNWYRRSDVLVMRPTVNVHAALGESLDVTRDGATTGRIAALVADVLIPLLNANHITATLVIGTCLSSFSFPLSLSSLALFIHTPFSMSPDAADYAAPPQFVAFPVTIRVTGVAGHEAARDAVLASLTTYILVMHMHGVAQSCSFACVLILSLYACCPLAPCGLDTACTLHQFSLGGAWHPDPIV